MSQEDFQKFLEAVRQDSSLQEKLKAATDADAVVAIAKAAGFVISADEFKKAQYGTSEEELEGIAGGMCSFFADDECGWLTMCTKSVSNDYSEGCVR
jgi:predicted ribosomally synthesized peptide with nif11-like leader